MKWFLCITLGLVLALASGCGEKGQKPLMRGEGDGKNWVPGKDGKFIVVTLQNTLDIDLLLVADGKEGYYQMQVGKGETRYIALKDDIYNIEPRGKVGESKYGKFEEKEEIFGGIRRIHLKAIAKTQAEIREAEAKAKAAEEAKAKKKPSLSGFGGGGK